MRIATLPSVTAAIEPEPTDSEREAILAALAETAREASGAWAEAALAEGVEEVALDP